MDNKDQEKYLSEMHKKLEALRGNPLLFMPIRALSGFINIDEPEAQREFEEDLLKISKTHPFIGGLLFENRKSFAHALNVSEETCEKIDSFLDKHGLSIGQIDNYNFSTELRNIMREEVKQAGIARRDKYEDALNKIIGNNPDVDRDITFEESSAFSDNDRLTIVFNLSTNLQESLVKANLEPNDITNILKTSVKRAIRSNFIQANNIGLATDSEEAMELYDSNEDVEITIKNGSHLIMRIPLTPIVNGAFNTKNNISLKQVGQKLAKTLENGIGIALALKADL